MEKYCIIGTTAINRIELHNDVLPDWIEWIINLKDYKFKWFINIDIIENLEDSYEETVFNFQTLTNAKDIEIKFLKNPDNKGDFLGACKRISNEIVNFVDEKALSEEQVKIIWLEDDWKLNKEIVLDINFLVNNYSGIKTYINLTYIRNNYIWALAPSIISYQLWKTVFWGAWEKQHTNIDPEHCAGLYYIKLFGKQERTKNLTVINKKVYPDFFKQLFMTYENSYYIYNNDKFRIDNSLNREKSIDELEDLKKDNLFIRITPSNCYDYGRKFLEKKNLIKLGTKNKEGFYGVKNNN